jgi:hypothetical protein
MSVVEGEDDPDVAGITERTQQVERGAEAVRRQGLQHRPITQRRAQS